MLFRYLCFYTCLHIALPAYADVVDELAGSFEATMNGRPVVLAALKSDYRITVNGDVANVSLTQTFENPYDQALNARYLFPLNKDAAVHAMTMYVGQEVISAQIQEIKQAKQTFEQAKQAGKAAALLEQHRPNMFTQKVANLMPGQPIKVVIEYAQIVPKVDGAYELVVPMVVGPRFQPAGAGAAPMSNGHGAAPESADATVADGGWLLEKLPAYPQAAGVHLPAHIVKDRVSLEVDLETPVPLTAVTSDTHPLAVQHRSSTQRRVTFADGQVLDNKDFVLRFQMSGAEVSAGLLSHWQSAEGGYFSLLIEPPQQVEDAQILPREMVFLLDCSGSMSGQPMAASKRFMRAALAALRPTDSFRIIRFSDSATEFSQTPLPATPFNIAQGLQYTNNLYGSGGTMMTSGIRQALSAPIPQGAVRNVVFLTDGYIGNEMSVLKLVRELLGDARLYAFGVGTGVNRYLMSELGKVGRGFTRYYDPTRDDESMETVALQLAAKLQTPVLTDLHIDWGDLQVSQVVPAELPDLYAGDTIRVTGRYAEASEGAIKITARSSQHQAGIVTQVALQRDVERPAVRRVWARTAVAELMHAFISPPSLRPDAMDNTKLQAAVTDLGLQYGLTTRWTAFVAVSRQVYNPDPTANAAADVALPKVAGVSKLAYSPQPMTGYGAPEPGLMLGLLAAALTFAGLRRRWRLTPR